MKKKPDKDKQKEILQQEVTPEQWEEVQKAIKKGLTKPKKKK